MYSTRKPDSQYGWISSLGETVISYNRKTIIILPIGQSGSEHHVLVFVLHHPLKLNQCFDHIFRGPFAYLTTT